MKKLRICLEVPGLAEDENGQPCPGGVCLTLGDDNAEEITGEAYRNLMKEINIAGILRMACLDGFCRPEDCRLLTPEEYDEKYGEEGRAWNG